VNEVLDDPATRAVYATDNSIYQIEPEAVAIPQTADDVAELVRANRARTRPRPVVARGAGTGTNGQSLTTGLVVDLKRRMNRIVDIDVDARRAVVEPGVVTAELDAELARHRLFWAPETSTVTRATVGGMISTDAAGKGSLVYGRTHRHVASLDVVLDDGTRWTAEPTPLTEAEALARHDDRIGRLWRDLLAIPAGDAGAFSLPDLARGFSGYGIDRLRRGDLIDPLALLCGAEGTLGIVTRATLLLTPEPSHTVLVVASYDDFSTALRDSIELRATAPIAIETFDETTLAKGRNSPAWGAMQDAIGDHDGAVLLLEYSAEVEPDVAAVEAALAGTARSRATAVVRDPAARRAIWKVRADAVGLLAKVVAGTHQPSAFVEDCAVPVDAMVDFIAGFRAALDRRGLSYGMFGHADVGCVHVRPAIDPLDPATDRLVREVTDEVVALVRGHGGILWGEHGRGLRGQYATDLLSPETLAVMRLVKAAFDPEDRFNPGKLYRPAGSDEPLVAVDEMPLRGQINRAVPVELRREFGDAFLCNGNGLCHHYGHAEVMCPSFKATGDPTQSPKGRADMLRAWLRNDAAGTPDDELTAALVDSLDRCLSCGACTGHCPVEVDIPELKSRFFERYWAGRRRPAAHAVLSRFEAAAVAASRLPGPLARLSQPAAERALGLVDLPSPPRRRAEAAAAGVAPFAPNRRRFGGRRRSDADRAERAEAAEVVLLPDLFTSVLEPATQRAAIEALRSCGWRVGLAPFVASAKFDHVKGRRRAFAAAAARQRDLVDAVQAAGAVPVVIEPAIALLHGHEYPSVLAAYPAGVVRNLADVLAERADRLAPVAEPRQVQLFGHCTERAQRPAWVAAWRLVLEAVGHDVTVVETTCCGMAGIFGHEVANQEVSRALFDMGWAPHLTRSGGAAPVAAATGFSCRSQAERLAGVALVHPVHLLS